MQTAGFDHLIGDVLQGTYRIERVVGKGGMGAVFEASHLRLKRRFAIKVLIPELAEMPEALARFKREAEITSAIGHPNILEVIDFNHDREGMPYIVMELLEGEPLSSRIKRRSQLALDEVAVIFRQLASALQAAHDQGIVHRDLKPQNIYLCQRGESDSFVKVFDFGISKVLGSQSALTRTRSALGTPYYMSPEQAEEDSANVDLRTDIFATGVILYELLTGRPPFVGDATLAVLFKIVNKPHRSICEVRPEVPAALGAVIDRALAKKRDGRFDSMGDFWRGYAEAVGCADLELRAPEGDGKVALTIQGIETASTFDASGSQGYGAGALAETVAEGEEQEASTDRRKATTLSSSVGEVGTEAPSRRPRSWMIVPALVLLAASVAGGAMLLSQNGEVPEPTAVEPAAAGAGTAVTAPPDSGLAAQAPLDAGVAQAPDAAQARQAVDAAVQAKRRQRARVRPRRAQPKKKRPPAVAKPAVTSPVEKKPAVKKPAAKTQPPRHLGKGTMGW